MVDREVNPQTADEGGRQALRWFRPESESDSRLESVAGALKNGELAILPTETVYGLACLALETDSVKRLIAAKKRPPDRPFILAVANVDAAKQLTSRWPESAQILARKFWPGPLTLVLPKAEIVPSIATAGGPNVAVRIPNSAAVLRILQYVEQPLVLTSANISSNPPPATAEAAVAQVGMACAYVVDAGMPLRGVESTVLDLTGPPRVLRQGAVSQAEIHSALDG